MRSYLAVALLAGAIAADPFMIGLDNQQSTWAAGCAQATLADFQSAAFRDFYNQGNGINPTGSFAGQANCEIQVVGGALTIFAPNNYFISYLGNGQRNCANQPPVVFLGDDQNNFYRQLNSSIQSQTQVSTATPQGALALLKCGSGPSPPPPTPPSPPASAPYLIGLDNQQSTWPAACSLATLADFQSAAFRDFYNQGNGIAPTGSFAGQDNCEIQVVGGALTIFSPSNYFISYLGNGQRNCNNQPPVVFLGDDQNNFYRQLNSSIQSQTQVSTATPQGALALLKCSTGPTPPPPTPPSPPTPAGGHFVQRTCDDASCAPAYCTNMTLPQNSCINARKGSYKAICATDALIVSYYKQASCAGTPTVVANPINTCSIIFGLFDEEQFVWNDCGN